MTCGGQQHKVCTTARPPAALLMSLQCMQVGLQPDVQCIPERTEDVAWSRGLQAGGGYDQDPCIQKARQLLQGSQ